MSREFGEDCDWGLTMGLGCGIVLVDMLWDSQLWGTLAGGNVPLTISTGISTETLENQGMQTHTNERARSRVGGGLRMLENCVKDCMPKHITEGCTQ